MDFPQRFFEPKNGITLRLILAGLIFYGLLFTHASFAQEVWREVEEMPTVSNEVKALMPEFRAVVRELHRGDYLEELCA